MSIEQKISELLDESKQLETEIAEETTEATDDVIAEEVVAEETEEVTAETEEEEVVAEESVEEEATEEVVADETAEEELTVDVSEDVAALVNGEELSEEFQAKAATIFEAAVVNRVKQEVARLEESYEVKLAEQVEEIQEGLVEKIDGYLGLMVEQWMEQNALALESGMKSEILEGFVGGLKNLFEEHYIEIPEEKYDILGDMEAKMEDLESKLTESVEISVTLKKELDAMKRAEAVAEAASGLTDTEVEKFNGLAEELSYEDVESFKTKLQTIRENYFVRKANAEVNSVVTDEPIVEEKVLNESMSRYVQSLGKQTF